MSDFTSGMSDQSRVRGCFRVNPNHLVRREATPLEMPDAICVAIAFAANRANEKGRQGLAVSPGMSRMLGHKAGIHIVPDPMSPVARSRYGMAIRSTSSTAPNSARPRIVNASTPPNSNGVFIFPLATMS
jgi:hypothetical protein